MLPIAIIILQIVAVGLLWPHFARLNKKLALTVSLYLVIASCGLYGYFGWNKLPSVDRNALKQLQALLVATKKQTAELEVQVVKNPANSELWQKLSSLYQLQQDFPNAALALHNACKLQPDNVKLQLQYVALKSKIMQGAIGGKELAMLHSITQSDPKQALAWYLLATEAKTRDDSKANLNYLQQCLISIKDVPEYEELRKHITEQIHLPRQNIDTTS